MDIDLELPSGREDRLDTPLTATTIDTEPNNVGGGENMMKDANVRKGITIMNNYEPRKGLEFETKEEAYSFYREYARSVGFGITIKASRRSKKSGRFIDVKIVCSRFGSKRSEASGSGAVNSRSPSSCPKTDCKASMHMKRRQDDGKWFIYCFVEEHNHEICPDDFFHAIKLGRNNKQLSSTSQKKKRGLQLVLDEGDVESLLDNFMLIQAENPGFFYAVDLDHQERHMRNVFWVDGKGRRDYGNFRDVICFDTTTYLRDKKYSNIPFAPIFGVNHHLQYILLGCALIGEETSSSTFVWLFRTWLRAVGGQTPGVIITTDELEEGQNNPLKEAIAEVFPDARHCFSLWHVLRKIPENLPPHILNNRLDDCFNAKFNKCIYRSWTEEEFEKRWWKMIDRFELREDGWVQSLYASRKKWVPTYMRDTCLSGLCTTTTELGGADDENTTTLSFFFNKLFINRETNTIKELMDNYRVFLHGSYEEEAKADSTTQSEQPTLRSVLPFEKQMSTVYTRALFEKFQVEVLGTVACNLLQKECGEGDETTTLTFRVDDLEKRKNFIVAWDEAKSDISCLCRLFEYRGFLCRHAMVVLEMCGVSTIPSHYILKRWTKDAKKISQIITTTSDGSSSSNRVLLRYRVQRFNDLCKLAVKLGGEGSLSQETYSIAVYALDEALRHCVGVSRSSVKSVRDPHEETLAASQHIIEEEETHSSHVAKATKKKKKPQKKQKVQSDTEVISIRMQECSQQMEMLNQRAQAFDTSSYVPQQDMQEMDMGSRTSNLDGYYVLPQQSIQAVGQLSLQSSGRNGYYSNQQGMHGLVGQSNSTPTRTGHYVPQQSLQELLQGQLSFRAPTMHGCFDIQDSLQQEEHDVEDMEQSANVTSKNLHN